MREETEARRLKKCLTIQFKKWLVSYLTLKSIAISTALESLLRARRYAH